MTDLNKNQILTWQTAYHFSKEDRKKGICFGNVPNTKDGKEFFAPFLKAGYCHADTLKYTGAFVLTDKGIAKFEELMDAIKV